MRYRIKKYSVQSEEFTEKNFQMIPVTYYFDESEIFSFFRAIFLSYAAFGRTSHLDGYFLQIHTLIIH